MPTLETSFPVAINSPDHIAPLGTIADNNTSIGLIEELEKFFGKKFSLIDLGCAGGQFVIDTVKSGNFGIGIEGSDHGLHRRHGNWPEYYNKNLFTADLTKEWNLCDGNGRLLVDCISAWEVCEHIAQRDFDMFFGGIMNHLKPDGIFIASISIEPDQGWNQGVMLHQSILLEQKWREEILPKYFKEVLDYPFVNSVNPYWVQIGWSFLVMCKGVKDAKD